MPFLLGDLHDFFAQYYELEVFSFIIGFDARVTLLLNNC